MFVLVWKLGPHDEQRVELPPGKSLTIGRDEGCDITIDDESASRRHARVQVVNGRVEVDDTGSRNGTWIGSKRITNATWQPGSPLKIGDTVLMLRGGPDASDQETVVVSKGGKTSPAAAAPASTATRETSSGNFIARHWRGGYSLGRSIFINTMLLSFAMAVLIANFTEEVAADSSPRARLVFITVVFAFSMAVAVWQIVGDWRSWRGAKSRGAGRVARWSSLVFIVLLVLSVPFTVFEFIATWSAIRDIETGQDIAGGPSHTLTKQDNVLVFDGVVTWPIVADFERILAENPDINVIALNSPGGDTVAGRRVNDILRERGVATAVLGTCASACTVMFAAGQRRAVGPDGQLGYHASAVILMDAMMTRIMNGLTFRNDSLNAEYYRRAGMDEAFIERAVTTPSTDLWVPSHDELLQANAIHEVLPP